MCTSNNLTSSSYFQKSTTVRLKLPGSPITAAVCICTRRFIAAVVVGAVTLPAALFFIVLIVRAELTWVALADSALLAVLKQLPQLLPDWPSVISKVLHCHVEGRQRNSIIIVRAEFTWAALGAACCSQEGPSAAAQLALCTQQRPAMQSGGEMVQQQCNSKLLLNITQLSCCVHLPNREAVVLVGIGANALRRGTSHPCVDENASHHTTKRAQHRTRTCTHKWALNGTADSELTLPLWTSVRLFMWPVVSLPWCEPQHPSSRLVKPLCRAVRVFTPIGSSPIEFVDSDGKKLPLGTPKALLGMCA